MKTLRPALVLALALVAVAATDDTTGKSHTYKKISNWQIMLPGRNKYNIGGITIGDGNDIQECKNKCDSMPECKLFNHHKDTNKCWFKSADLKANDNIDLYLKNSAGECPLDKGYTNIGGDFGRCLKFVQELTNLVGAKAKCQGDGGRLAMAKTQQSFQQLMDLVGGKDAEQMDRYNAWVYIGAEKNSQGELVWADGSTLPKDKTAVPMWKGEKFDNDRKTAVMIYTPWSEMAMTYAGLNWKKYFICEI